MFPSRLLAALLFIGIPCLQAAHASDPSVATIWRLLDYIAVDYPEAVQNGKVVNPQEYNEMLEFSAMAANSIDSLPIRPKLPTLQKSAADLRQAIQSKDSPTNVAMKARTLAANLIQRYPIPLKPAKQPDYEKGRALYAQNCASCHGQNGAGDGPVGIHADPPPIDFTDRTRANQRSLFALYQVIHQGLDGTSMASFSHLPDDEIWALATYIGSLSYSQSQVKEGRKLFEEDSSIHATVNIDQYIGMTPASLGFQLGQTKAEAVVAYLRRHPEALKQKAHPASLGLARNLLQQSVEAYRNGYASQARELALAAYLDGFEPVEPLLSARDKDLMVRIEGAMAKVRSGLSRNVSFEDLETQILELDRLFAEAENTLSSNQTSVISSFIAAFTILLREGLEALLIVLASIAMLRKAGRAEMLPWVHAGWLSALLVGLGTWILATWVISISGASRELTEGFGALFAAIVLVWVGLWMHGKSHADAWQRYVKEKLGRTLNKKSGLFLLILVFVVVYREVFETILFLTAIWSQGSKEGILTGSITAIFALTVLGWLMMRYSRRLPIGRFFRYSAVLISVLAVVLTGKAVSAFQEAGYLPITLWEGGLRIELLGIYPTPQGMLAQVGVAAGLLIGFTFSYRASKT